MHGGRTIPPVSTLLALLAMSSFVQNFNCYSLPDISSSDLTLPIVSSPEVTLPIVSSPDVTLPIVSSLNVILLIASLSCVTSTFDIPITLDCCRDSSVVVDHAASG